MRALLFALLIPAMPAQAQQGVFVKAAYAWNWSASTNAELRFLPPPRPGGFPFLPQETRVEADPGTFGSGQAVWMEVGYRLSERLGFGVGIRHMVAPNTLRAVVDYRQYALPGETILTRRAVRPLFLEPGITVFLPLGDKAEAHFRAGALVPVRHTIRSESYSFDTTDQPYWQTATELRTRFGIGAFGGAGVTAELGAGFGLFLQADFGLLSLRARDETVLAIVINAVDVTADLPEAQRRIEYLDGALYNPATPNVSATYPVPFNFWSAELGVRWGLWP